MDIIIQINQSRNLLSHQVLSLIQLIIFTFLIYRIVTKEKLVQ